MLHLLRSTVTVLLVACTGSPVVAQIADSKDAEPIEPIDAIVNAAESHDLVAITVHGHEETHAVLLGLLREPRFTRAIDDIVVEFGSARFQDVMDRFVTGADIPYAELQQVWQQTTQPHHVNDVPIFEEFFRVVRARNAASNGHTLRVVLAEPPIDWSLIEDFGDLLPWLQRRFPYEAEVVEREVLERDRKALLLSGSGHYIEGTPLLGAIERHGATLFKVWTTNEENLADVQPNARSWPTPSLTYVEGTVLGATNILGFYMPMGVPPGPFQEQFDAILYLGPPERLTPSKIVPELCSDPEYLSMRLPRLEMAARNGAPGWLAEFRSHCSAVAPR
jgi:hypothetical protein